MFLSCCCTKLLLAGACCSWFVPKLLVASFSFWFFCAFSCSSGEALPEAPPDLVQHGLVLKLLLVCKLPKLSIAREADHSVAHLPFVQAAVSQCSP